MSDYLSHEKIVGLLRPDEEGHVCAEEGLPDYIKRLDIYVEDNNKRINGICFHFKFVYASPSPLINFEEAPASSVVLDTSLLP